MDAEHEKLTATLERLLQEANLRPSRPAPGLDRSDWLDPHAEAGRKKVGEVRLGLYRYSVHADCSRAALQELIDGIKSGREASRVAGPRGADKLGLDEKPITNLQIYVD